MEVDLTSRIYFAENIDVLRTLPSASVDLVYIDPPFNTGKVQQRTQLKMVRSTEGDRVGFQGNRYESLVVGTKRFSDVFDDYLALGFPCTPRSGSSRTTAKTWSARAAMSPVRR